MCNFCFCFNSQSHLEIEFERNSVRDTKNTVNQRTNNETIQKSMKFQKNQLKKLYKG